MPTSVITEQPVLAGVTEIFRAVFNDPDLELTSRSTADEVPGWDSMTHITLIVEAECRFGILFQAAEIESLYSVGELVRAIEAKRAPAAGGASWPAAGSRSSSA
ncbi:MAG TPA: acyl carrier protein [Acetobacteraceae bacterium]|nr:acyl carrier protein [Acetobacteraceae bacterium]